MAVFKCKMCGAPLDVSGGSTTIECEYCGSQQTLPRLSDDRISKLYEMANRFRRNSDFDKAKDIYEQIVLEYPDDAESHWSMVLCEHGILYVEDPVTKERKPTINRTQMKSIFNDPNYLQALSCADEEQKKIYQAEAQRIYDIQKKFWEVIQNEPPYDVFICFKATDENGNQTEDTGIGVKLYDALERDGLRTFFSRYSLDDKLGKDYEPYIFAALSTAKVMVVLGTKPEYFQARWVRNEWSRFMALRREHPEKLLIPAYKDMDAYELPDEFTREHLQAKNLGEIAADIELVRKIKSVIGPKEAPKPVVQEVHYGRSRPGAVNVENFLRRVVHFMEDGDWNSADIYCEKVLDADSENGAAYLYKLMIQCRVSSMNGLHNQDTPLERRSTYKNAVRYADEQTAAQLTEFNRLQKEMEQRRQREAELAEQRRRVLSSLRSAQSNAQDHIRDLLNQKEQLEVYSTNKALEAQGITKEKKSIRIPAIISLLTALLTIYMTQIVGMSADDCMVIFIINTVFAAILAGRRLNSRLAAVILNIISMSIFHFELTALLSAIKALWETRTLSKKDIEKEQAQISRDLANIEIELNKARASLSEINVKLEEFV